MFSNNSRSLRYSTIFLLPPQNFLRAHISRLGKGEAAARHKPVEETRFSSERVARFLMRATRRGRDVITWPGIPSVCHSLQREASRRQRWPELLPSVFSTENTEPERRLSTTPQRIPTERCLLPLFEDRSSPPPEVDHSLIQCRRSSSSREEELVSGNGILQRKWMFSYRG